MQGKLITCSISHMGEYTHLKHKFLITHICNDNPTVLYQKYGFLWCPSLAPSAQIFSEYKKLKKQNQWNTYTFENWYTPTFLHYLLNNKKSTDMLNYIYLLLKQGEDVVIACYCGSIDMCHRKLVGNEYARLGFTIEYR